MAKTVADFTDRVGKAVVYHPHEHAAKEAGVITSVNETYVFVRFRNDFESKACRPEDLEFSFKEIGSA